MINCLPLLTSTSWVCKKDTGWRDAEAADYSVIQIKHLVVSGIWNLEGFQGKR